MKKTNFLFVVMFLFVSIFINIAAGNKDKSCEEEIAELKAIIKAKDEAIELNERIFDRAIVMLYTVDNGSTFEIANFKTGYTGVISKNVAYNIVAYTIPVEIIDTNIMELK